MSHKTIYIDIDEEITSVIDRMRKAEAGEVIIVAPKRALLLQSLVNLKLLKKEADRRKRRIMIVTQDKIGKKLIEKAGILAHGKVDDSMADNGETEEPAIKGKQLIKNQELIENIEGEQEEEPVGSDSYFDEPLKTEASREAASPGEGLKNSNIDKIQFEIPAFEKTENIQSKSAKRDSARKVKDRGKPDKSVQMSDIVAGSKPKSKRKEENIVEKKDEENYETEKTPLGSGQFYKKSGHDPHFENQTEKFFSGTSIMKETVSRRKAGKLNERRLKGKVGRYFVFFAIAIVVLGGLALAYYYFPKAKITLYLKSQVKSSSVDIEASLSAAGVKGEEGIAPAKLEQLEKEKKEEFNATGSKNGGGKAIGKVVIYNDFSADNQPLVSTTRLETADGKIFRITKSIIVPGMTKVGTETKSGAIEVDVVADKAGREYNIDPADFKIPGFKGGPKFDKFYARSAKAMTGGSTGETPLVSSQDISQAKEKIIAEAKEEAIRDLKQSLPAERKIFDDSVVVELESAAPSAAAGTETDKFFYTVKVRAKTISFSEDDVKEIIRMKTDENREGTISFKTPLNYMLSEENLEKGYVKFEVKTDLETAGDIDLENFRKGVLGKNSDEIASFAKAYPAVLKADVSFWPFFTTRAPMNEKRVEIEIK
ncbi:MAG: hypothetical protein Q8L09_03790 [Candidatus Moranbacteria bacterium]|nr:hypothetical protein [Candidatus Moranbacteria bacterium]